MHNRQAFADGMSALGVNARCEVTDQQRELYWTMLRDLTDEQFQRAVLVALQNSRFFPTIAELRQAVTPHVDHQAEAVLAFDRVRLSCGTYDPCRGTTWSIRTVAEAEGPLAAEAFAAAGGSSAFEREQNERDLPFLRRRFVESYVAAAEAQAAGRPVALAVSTPKLPRGAKVQALIRDLSVQLSPPKED